jgi:hypothetical protein
MAATVCVCEAIGQQIHRSLGQAMAVDGETDGGRDVNGVIASSVA